MEVNDFLRKYAPRLGTRPEFFSGRGATSSDLNSDILEGIYLGLDKVMGRESAKNYILLVARFKCLSATAFLNDFINWYCSGCKEYEVTETTDIDLGPDRDLSSIIGMATIMSKMYGNNRDDTYQIRSNFLWKHREELAAMGYDYRTFIPSSWCFQ